MYRQSSNDIIGNGGFEFQLHNAYNDSKLSQPGFNDSDPSQFKLQKEADKSKLHPFDKSQKMDKSQFSYGAPSSIGKKSAISHISKINTFDVNRMSSLYKLFKNLSSATDVIGVMTGIINTVKNVLNCQHGSFYIFKPDVLPVKNKYDIEI